MTGGSAVEGLQDWLAKALQFQAGAEAGEKPVVLIVCLRRHGPPGRRRRRWLLVSEQPQP